MNKSANQTIDWAADAVWYQIFPERFRNGDPSNDPTRPLDHVGEIAGWQPHPWGSDFYARQPWETGLRPNDFYWMHMNRRYGGDLQGVIDKLDYLQDLGITAIYLNPIFNADSHHKYDGSTYHHIDYYFGPDPAGDAALVAEAGETDDPATWVWTAADRLFMRLVSEVHNRGMHIIIDGVFNHVGRSHFAFQDVLEKQQESVYANWFEVEQWDDPATPENEFAYNGWWGYMHLPEINEENGTVVDGPRQYIFNSVKRWMDPNEDGDPADGIDGWRLDVVNDMGQRWWREWHQYIRTVNPQIFTTAEIWEVQPDITGPGMFYSSMNYPFAMAALDFIGDVETQISPSEFVARLDAVRAAYGFEISLGLQNLVDSHDTDRLPTILMNPDRGYDREARPDQNAGEYRIGKPSPYYRQLQKLIVALQVTYVGAPMFYAGDEMGMWGEDDPGCRKPMLWPDITYENESAHPTGKVRASDPVAADLELHAFYREAIALRHEHNALRRGNYKTLIADDETGLVAFARWTPDEYLVVLINSAGKAATYLHPEGYDWKILYQIGDVQASANVVQIGAHSFALYERKP